MTALLLATGAEPRRIPIPGADLAGVHYLRTLADCDALRERLDTGGRVVVVGARLDRQRVRGLRASARARGDACRSAGAADRADLRGGDRCLLPRCARTARRRAGTRRGRRGVRGRRCARARAHRDRRQGDRVRLRRRRDRRGAARRSSRKRRPGGRTTGSSSTRRCRHRRRACSRRATSPHAWHPFFGERIRVEHWANALNQGPAAARAMLGEAVSYDRIPYFFSDQYDVGMEYSGYATKLGRGGVPRRPRRRRVHRLLAAGRPRRGGHERQRVGRQRARPGVDPLAPPVDVAALRDRDTPLESLAGEPGSES